MSSIIGLFPYQRGRRGYGSGEDMMTFIMAVGDIGAIVALLIQKGQLPFGVAYRLNVVKHRGKTMGECPRGYINWLASERVQVSHIFSNEIKSGDDLKRR